CSGQRSLKAARGQRGPPIRGAQTWRLECCAVSICHGLLMIGIAHPAVYVALTRGGRTARMIQGRIGCLQSPRLVPRAERVKPLTGRPQGVCIGPASVRAGTARSLRSRTLPRRNDSAVRPLVPKGGLEPPREYSHYALNVAR